MKFDWLTTQVAIVLVSAMLLICVVLIGVPVWLVATGRAAPTLLAAPIGMVLTGAASAAVAWSKAIVKAPPGFALVSVPPPPTEAELLGETYPATTSSVLPPTAPATPDSKKRTLL